MNTEVAPPDMNRGRTVVDLPSGHLLIDGAWRPSADGSTIPVFDPASGEAFSAVAAAGAADVDLAVRAARRAFEARSWQTMRPLDRGRLLERVALLIEEHADALALLESIDNGKPLWMARMVDVQVAIDMFRYHAGLAARISGEVPPLSAALPDGSSFLSYTLREPVGVVAAITPWNFALGQAAQKIAPAIATGCTVVLKPSENTPLATLRLGELILDAGFPPGVVNILTGYGDDAGAALVAHPMVSKVSFTGSTRVGKQLVAAAASDLKRISLELGGKSPSIVLADADLETTIPGVADAIFFNAGQICTAGSRLIIERPIFDAVMEGVTDIARSLKVGRGTDPGTQIGPLVSDRQQARVSDYVEQARQDGATVLAGGTRPQGDGYFYSPTVIGDVTPDMAIAREEVFGPVLIAMAVDDIAEIPALANDSRYGLGASIWTQNLDKAHLLAKRIEAGTVWINTHNILDSAMPFGGVKESGWGREFGNAAIESYTEVKSVCLRLKPTEW